MAPLIVTINEEVFVLPCSPKKAASLLSFLQHSIADTLDDKIILQKEYLRYMKEAYPLNGLVVVEEPSEPKEVQFPVPKMVLEEVLIPQISVGEIEVE